MIMLDMEGVPTLFRTLQWSNLQELEDEVTVSLTRDASHSSPRKNIIILFFEYDWDLKEKDEDKQAFTFVRQVLTKEYQYEGNGYVQRV